MTQDPIHAHHQSGRRPLTLAMLAFAVGMVVLGLVYAAPWYWMAIVGLAALALLFMVWTNTQSGSLVTRDTLRFFHGKTDRTLRIADIAGLHIQRWSDGPDGVELELKSGERIDVPAEARGKGFVDALKQTDVPEL
jgi:hypothetical protein